MAIPLIACRTLLPCMLLALPLAAFANPFTVTTRSSGIANVNPTVLYYLGMDNLIEATELPYELTMRSTFDPVEGLPGRGESIFERESQVVVEFRLGDMRFDYTGRGMTWASVYTPFDTGDAYWHQLDLDNLSFSQRGYAPTGTLGPGGALAMRELGGITSGRFWIDAVPTNPDAPGYWSMNGAVNNFSVSAVPEPALYALMAAGLFVLGWRRMRT